MNSVNVILSIVACLAICASGWANPRIAMGESKFLQAMRSSSAVLQSNPAQSLLCFQYYSEVFDQLLKQYEEEYAQCLNTSVLQQEVLDERYRPVLLDLNRTAVAACDQLHRCNNQSSLDGLSCYSDVGQENVRVMYNISSSASASYSQLQQAIQLVQFTEEQCGNASKRNYELSTDQAYIRLQNCLAGLEPVPTALTSTTATEIITTTTSEVSSSETTVTTAIPTTISTQKTRRTRRASKSTTAIPYSTSFAMGSKNSFSSELQKLLHSLAH